MNLQESSFYLTEAAAFFQSFFFLEGGVWFEGIQKGSNMTGF